MTKSSIVSYSLLAFCLAFIGLPIYIYLPHYYHDNFGISLQTIGIILLCTRLIDTIQDPLFGIISDKLSCFRRKIIFYSTPFLGISFLLLFYPLVQTNIGIWLTVFLIITYSLFSLMYINYQACAVSFSQNYNQKTTIIAYREFFFVFGIICATVIPALLSKFWNEINTFLIIGVAYTVLISVFGWIFYQYTPNSANSKATVQRQKSILFSIFINKEICYYFIIFALNAFSSAIPAVLIMFFVEKYLQLPNFSWLFLLLYFVGLLIGVPLWTQVSFLFKSKIKTWIVSISVTIVVFSMCYFLQKGDIIFYSLICLFSGIGFGGDLCLGYSYLTDIIQKYQFSNQESTIFGITNFILKFALAISSGILIYFIGVFEESKYMQTNFIYLNYIIPPIILRLISVTILYKKCLKK